MSLPERFTVDELLLELGRVKPVPLAKFARSCPRCHAEAPKGVVHGYYTDEGLKRHMAEAHGERP